MLRSRPRTYTYRRFEPASVRRRRRYAVGLSALAVAGTVHVMAGPHGSPVPRALDTAAIEVTHLGPRVVVYSLPRRRGPNDHNSGQGGSHGGDAGSRSGERSRTHSGEKSQGGSTSVAPEILDGPSGRATVTNTTPQGSTTYTNGSSEDADSGSGRSPSPPIPGGRLAPTTPAVSGTPVWPPLQTESGTPAASPTGAPSAPQLATPHSDAPTLSPAPATTASTPPPSVASLPQVPQPATVLLQVQCPQAQPGLWCFEAASFAGAPAPLPPATRLPDLPVLPSPGLATPCSLAPNSGGSAGHIGDPSNSGSSNHSRSESSQDSDSAEGSGRHSGGSHKGRHGSKRAADAAPVVPDNSGSGSASRCGLFGTTTGGLPSATGNGVGNNSVGSGLGGGVTRDLSALEAESGERIELSGYSFQDNQGGNNAKISCPQIHQQAGGTGTYDDPITVASGGKDGSSSSDGVKCGDRFYLPSVQRYVIVEDTGNTPNKSMPHLDMYVADDPNKSCMNTISGTVTAIPHPPPGLPVMAGPIGDHGGCRLPGETGSGSGQS